MAALSPLFSGCFWRPTNVSLVRTSKLCMQCVGSSGAAKTPPSDLIRPSRIVLRLIIMLFWYRTNLFHRATWTERQQAKQYSSPGIICLLIFCGCGAIGTVCGVNEAAEGASGGLATSLPVITWRANCDAAAPAAAPAKAGKATLGVGAACVGFCTGPVAPSADPGNKDGACANAV